MKRVFRRFFVKWKYRFDMGYQFMALLNLILLSITSSNHLKNLLHMANTYFVVGLTIAFGFVGVFGLGWFLDRGIRYMEAYNDEAMSRNPQWDLMMEKMDRILESKEE